MTEDRIGDLRLPVLKALVRDLLVRAERMDLFDDVYQEASLAAWLAIETFDPAKGQLGARQYSRARFAALDELRRQTYGDARRAPRPQPVSLEDMPPDYEPSTDEPGYDDVETADLAAWVEAEIRAVWPHPNRHRRRDVALARILEDRAGADLAREAGVSDAAVSQVMTTTRRRLAARWTDQDAALPVPRRYVA